MTRYLLLFDSYGLVFAGLPSLTSGRVCLLYMLLALASAVCLGSESLWTRDHITVSDLRLPFSTPPTTRGVTVKVLDPASTRGTDNSKLAPLITPRHGPYRKHRSSVAVKLFPWEHGIAYRRTAIYFPPPPRAILVTPSFPVARFSR
jgi:hypothetical protein